MSADQTAAPSVVIDWPGDYPPTKLRVSDYGDALCEVTAFEPGRFRVPIELGRAYSLSFVGVWSGGLLGLGLDWLARRFGP